MPHAGVFESDMFACRIMGPEVEDIAVRRYGGASSENLAKAFAFWCIKNISPKLQENEWELARTICEGTEPWNEPIDGAWIDKDAGTLYLMQSKYSAPEIPVEPENQFKEPVFGPESAEELQRGFAMLYEYATTERGKTTTDHKLLQLMALYGNANKDRLQVILLVVISGKPKKPLYEKVDQIRSAFDRDRRRFERHNCKIYDLDELNQIVSDNRAKPPDTVYLNTGQSFILDNPDGSIYAVAATVGAKELIRVREQCGYNLYHSNFRFMLKAGKGVARPKIERTLSDSSERKNFWRYNNGITIACQTAKAVTPTRFEVTGMQVVNGLQTIETLFENKDKDGWIDDVRLLVRVIPTREHPEGGDGARARQLEEHIAEYSNSQTPIEARDLRSNDSVQVMIERTMSEIYNLKYIRKAGTQSGLRGRPARELVDNLKAAQAALSFWLGLSTEAKTKTKLIFEKSTSATPGFYESIFNDSTSSEYILLPFSFWMNERQFARKVKDEPRKSDYKRLDLLALAVVGDAFKTVERLAGEPSMALDVGDKLKSAIKAVGSLGDHSTKTLWEPVLESLCTVARRHREAEAAAKKVDPSEITMRNVILKMRYTDEELREEIWQEPGVRALPEVLGRVLGL